MRKPVGKALLAGAISTLAAFPLSFSRAQDNSQARAQEQVLSQTQSAPGAPQYWYIHKTKGGIYQPPNRPLWRLADLLRMHAGHNNWSQPILKDVLQEVTYNSAAPGAKFIPRLHIETASVYVVIRGEMHFHVEGQQPVTATRGSIVNILNDTIYSYDVGGSQNALWININPAFYATEYPASEPPPPLEKGSALVKVAFAHQPPAYTGNNELHFNLFEALGKCLPYRGVVIDEHIYMNPVVSWVNPADNKCPGQTPASQPADPAPINPKTAFGHLHTGNREWWIIQAGASSGQFENVGVLHAVEGDVLNAAPMTWHAMAAEAPSGPSVRTSVSAYVNINMENTVTP